MAKGRSRKRRSLKAPRRADVRTSQWTGPAQAPPATRPFSATARTVVERVAVGPQYLEDNFIRIMQRCAILRHEPEFADLYFAPRPLLAAAARHFPRFRKRLERAARRGMATVASAYDGYRIAVLHDLDTPEFRSQLQRRLKRCTDRLLAGHDAEKIELVLCMSAWLGAETGPVKDEIPLGLYGLITTIYEDSFDRAMMEVPEAHALVGEYLYDLWCIGHRVNDLVAIAAATEPVTTFDQLGRQVATDPALAVAWQRQESYLLQELQSHQTQGGLLIRTDFFTADDVALVMRKMEQQHWNRPWSLSRYIPVLAMVSFVQCLREAANEIMTPQRIAEMIAEWRAAGQACLEADDERLRALTPHVLAVIQSLQRGEPPSSNPVLTTTYLVSCFTAWSVPDALSPQWQRFFNRLGQSRLVHKISEALRTDRTAIGQEDDE